MYEWFVYATRENVHNIRTTQDKWTAYIQVCMTSAEMRTWLDENKWGGDNPYLKLKDKEGRARTIATMILTDGYGEPKELA